MDGTQHMSFWAYTPRSLRVFLLQQPLTDNTLEAIRASFTPQSHDALREKLGLEWRRSYNSLLAIGILIVSAYVIYCILR